MFHMTQKTGIGVGSKVFFREIVSQLRSSAEPGCNPG
jgi:hypothetical protein